MREESEPLAIARSVTAAGGVVSGPGESLQAATSSSATATAIVLPRHGITEHEQPPASYPGSRGISYTKGMAAGVNL